MIVRAWKQSDNVAVAALEKECFSDAWTLEMVSETACQNGFCGVVCEQDGQVVGYVGAIRGGDVADIALVAVKQQFRRRGYAEQMLQGVIKNLNQNGVNNIFLEVRTSNTAAQSLYRKLGFVAVGIRKKYYENTEDAIVMAKGI